MDAVNIVGEGDTFKFITALCADKLRRPCRHIIGGDHRLTGITTQCAASVILIPSVCSNNVTPLLTVQLSRVEGDRYIGSILLNDRNNVEVLLRRG